MARSGTRRCHLTLSIPVWEALMARAVDDMVAVSVVADNVLRNALGLQSEACSAAGGKGGSSGGTTRRGHRLSIEKVLWNRLEAEAVAHSVSVPAWIRHRLRVAVLEIDSVKREAPEIPTADDCDLGEQRATKSVMCCEL